jgi:hypothetical protein
MKTTFLAIAASKGKGVSVSFTMSCSIKFVRRLTVSFFKALTFAGKQFIKTKSTKEDSTMDRMENHAIQAQIRKIFDLEFSKIYQGSLSVPIQGKSGQIPPWQNGNNYLVFISDKFKKDSDSEDSSSDGIQSLSEDYDLGFHSR